jgi:hypothetical protein
MRRANGRRSNAFLRCDLDRISVVFEDPSIPTGPDFEKIDSRLFLADKPGAPSGNLYFILHLLYDVMVIPFGMMGFCDCE